MQQADITSITRELAGLVAEHYVFPGLAAEISQLLDHRAAAGGYAAAPDEAALATALPATSSRSTATSICGCCTARPSCPNATMRRPGWPPSPVTRTVPRGESPGSSGSTATSATSTSARCCSPRPGRGSRGRGDDARRPGRRPPRRPAPVPGRRAGHGRRGVQLPVRRRAGASQRSGRPAGFPTARPGSGSSGPCPSPPAPGSGRISRSSC